MKHAAENQRDGDFLGANLGAGTIGRHAHEGHEEWQISISVSCW